MLEVHKSKHSLFSSQQSRWLSVEHISEHSTFLLTKTNLKITVGCLVLCCGVLCGGVVLCGEAWHSLSLSLALSPSFSQNLSFSLLTFFLSFSFSYSCSCSCSFSFSSFFFLPFYSLFSSLPFTPTNTVQSTPRKQRGDFLLQDYFRR